MDNCYHIICNKDKLSKEILSFCLDCKNIERFAYIEHRENCKSSHYHIFVEFKKGVNDVCKFFEVLLSVRNIFVESVKVPLSILFRYFLFHDKSVITQNSCDTSAIVANFDWLALEDI